MLCASKLYTFIVQCTVVQCNQRWNWCGFEPFEPNTEEVSHSLRYVHIVQCIMNIIQCASYNEQDEVKSVKLTLYSLEHTMNNIKGALSSEPYN